MVVAPHHLASEAGLRILREGGNAIEAMVATCATIAVVYPHMNGIGGDNFWLVRTGEGAPVGIDACGGAGHSVDMALYSHRGYSEIPSRGPLAACTVAGAVSGWLAAYNVSRRIGGRMPMSRLLEDAVYHARHGVPVTLSQHENTRSNRQELEDVPGFADLYLPEGRVPAVGELFVQPALADTLERLGGAGLHDFYTGDIADAIATDLRHIGGPLDANDLKEHAATEVAPLCLRVEGARVYNLPPPTQGLASLIILGLFERLGCTEADGYDFMHGLVEATKQAFGVRDEYVTDPAYMKVSPADFLDVTYLDEIARRVDATRAKPWDYDSNNGDTVWLGAIDADGRAVSCIQSLYWEFGSGIVLPRTGITWQNRGTSFRLTTRGRNSLIPGRKPFHTIQPPLAVFDDGRTMVYGTMGGDGQPQTQAAIFCRYAMYGQELQQSVTAPRWLLGRTWGEQKASLRVESRFPPHVRDALKNAGHDVEVVGPFDPIMGHAGAIVRCQDGVLEGAVDPRSDGVVAAY